MFLDFYLWCLCTEMLYRGVHSLVCLNKYTIEDWKCLRVLLTDKCLIKEVWIRNSMNKNPSIVKVLAAKYS